MDVVQNLDFINFGDDEQLVIDEEFGTYWLIDKEPKKKKTVPSLYVLCKRRVTRSSYVMNLGYDRNIFDQCKYHGQLKTLVKTFLIRQRRKLHYLTLSDVVMLMKLLSLRPEWSDLLLLRRDESDEVAVLLSVALKHRNLFFSDFHKYVAVKQYKSTDLSPSPFSDPELHPELHRLELMVIEELEVFMRNGEPIDKKNANCILRVDKLFKSMELSDEPATATNGETADDPLPIPGISPLVLIKNHNYTEEEEEEEEDDDEETKFPRRDDPNEQIKKYIPDDLSIYDRKVLVLEATDDQLENIEEGKKKMASAEIKRKREREREEKRKIKERKAKEEKELDLKRADKLRSKLQSKKKPVVKTVDRSKKKKKK